MHKEYFLCSEGCIETMQPEERSEYLVRVVNNVAVAKINYENFVKVNNTLDEDQRALLWAHPIEEEMVNLDISSFDIKKHHGKAFFDWMFDELGFVKTSSHCLIIHRVAVEQGLNPIELFNKLAKK